VLLGYYWTLCRILHVTALYVYILSQSGVYYMNVMRHNIVHFVTLVSGVFCLDIPVRVINRCQMCFIHCYARLE